MDKKMALITIVILLVILTGCGRFGPTDEDRGELITPSEAEIHKGFNALKMEFVKGQPPGDVWEGTDFPITMRIRNDGANDINRGLLAVSGNLHFSTIKDLQFSLEGKSEFNPEGEFSFEKFPSSAVEVDEDKTDSFFVVGCYEYKTTASTTICINPNIFEEGRVTEGECEMGTHSFGGGQGAPVAVTQVEEQMIPVGDKLRINLKIHVSNRGGGKVVERGSYMKDCGGGVLSREEIGVIQIDSLQFSSYRLGDDYQYPIICSNVKDNKFALKSTGDFVIDCYADLDPVVIGSSSFTTPLVTQLSYGYSQLSEQKTLIIKNSPG